MRHDTGASYHGLLVVPERNSSNVPLVSYTRGLDLSATLDGAGGIGGLLARSHGYSSGSWTNHNMYHADGNGNITAMVSPSQTLVASYRYDAYGGTTYSSGTLASANVYRFSSKPIHVNSGLYYYGYRFYWPDLQRWQRRDPLGEFPDGPNLYAFVANNPITTVDIDGLTWRSNWKFFWDWVLRRGSIERCYGGNTVESQEMSKSPGGNALRDDFYKGGCKDVLGFNYGTLRAYWDTTIDPFTANWGSTGLQVGGFSGATAKNNGDGTVTFCIPNVAGISSFFFHIPPNNLFGANGPMGNICQTFCWTEPIDKKGCKCYK